MMKRKFNVGGMTCAACQAHVEKAVLKLEGIKNVNVNLLQNTMVVEYDESICNDSKIMDSVSKAGYTAYLPLEKKTEVSKDYFTMNLIISIVLLFVLMYFSMGNMMFGFPVPGVFDMHENPMGFALIQFILVLPIVFINRSYFVSGFKKLIKRTPNMDSLIAIGASFSLAYGIYCLFMISYGYVEYHMYLYFESAGMILVFVSLGKYFERISKKKTTKSLEYLMNLAPKKARVLRNDQEIVIPTEEVVVGDIVILKKGDSIPVDGIIIDGSASIEEANITGESLPKYKTVGDSLYSSTLLTAGYLKMKATKVGKDTSIATIISLVEEASNSKAPISKLADKVSGIFVPLIFIISLIVFIGNILYVHFDQPSFITSSAFETALNFAITVIVIACPCALGLATPVAIMVGTGKGAVNGLLIKNAEVLENAHYIKTVVLDKTGTITLGKPRMEEYIELSNKVDTLSILYSLEAISEHPLASAIVEYAKEKKKSLLKVEEFNSIDGMGIKGRIDNILYFVGNKKGVESLNIKTDSIKDILNKISLSGATPLILTNEKEILSAMALKDPIKENSIEAIEQMHQLGIKVVMLTGDNKTTAEAIARETKVDMVISDVLPTDKQKVIEDLKSDGSHLVAMVGDGVNDALALTSADLGISIGSGSDIALESSDIVLVRNDLLDVINVIQLSKRVIRTIKLGLFWAFFYNIICVILSTGVFYYLSKGAFKMEPMYGAIAMSISSVSVVLNALTINGFKVKKSNKIETIEKEEEKIMETITINVEGMMCNHCKAHVEQACKKVANVINAEASLENKNVVVEYNNSISKEELIKNIIDAGYEVK